MANKLTAADLRVGNYVYSGINSNEIIKVYPIFLVQFSKIQEEKHNIKPIPLTEERLTKLGCEKRLGLFYPFNDGANNLVLNYIDGSYYPILTQEPDDSRDECQMVSLNKIDFVHEFQNLIYALTNTELTFKEDNQ